jgi:3-deoxy-D-manno-octulosonic-acid transferase
MSRGAALAFAVYGFVGWLASPVIDYGLARRRRRGKEHDQRWTERLGRASIARPSGPLVWLHGASVGEALSSLPLILRLRADYPDATILVTSGTVTSAALMAERLPPGALHQFVPVDTIGAVRRFLDHWRPDIALWLESELWPTLLFETARRDVPLVLLNGRLSETSFKRWLLVAPLARAVLSAFRLLLVQTPEDAARFAALGAYPVRSVGNLKKAAEPLPCDEAELAALRPVISGRPVWLAASTHPGEEAIVAALHASLARRYPNLLTILVPRHPTRGDAIIAELAGHPGLGALVRRTGGGAIPASACLYLADTLGELGLWYRLVDLALVGGTLGDTGGHNPLEPAQLGCAILLGPDMRNFAEIAADLIAAGGAVQAPNAAALENELASLLSDRVERGRIAELARDYVRREAGVLDEIEAALKPHLAPIERQSASGVV